MRPERPLTTQGRERKQQLLDAAGRMFAERGYAETRVIDIARAGGVAKGLFYWYFENKETLFRELVEDMRLRLRRRQAEAMDPDADALTRIAQATVASVRFMAANAPFFAVLEVESRDGRFAEVFRRGTEIHAADLVALLREAIDAGLVVDEDVTLLAYGVVGAVGYYSHFHRDGRIDRSVEELARFVARSVVRTLAADDNIAVRVLSADTGGEVAPGVQLL